MRKVLFLTTLLAFVLTSSVWAADISGNWTLKWSGRQGEESVPIVIKAAGDKLTVTAKHPTLGDMAGTGTLKGNDITMNLTATGEMEIGFDLKGTLTGNKMAGTREIVRPAGAQGGAQSGRGQAAGGQGAPTGAAQGAPQGMAEQGAPSGQGGQAPAGAQAGQQRRINLLKQRSLLSPHQNNRTGGGRFICMCKSQHNSTQVLVPFQNNLVLSINLYPKGYTMKKYLVSDQWHKNIIKFLPYICLTFVITIGVISIIASGGGGGGASEENEDNNDVNLTNEYAVDYDSNPGCDTSDEACAMVMSINADRKDNTEESDSAPAIKWNNSLAAVAQAHSENMCEQRQLAHELDAKDPFDRMADAGIDFVTAGENVAMGTDGVYDLEDLEDLFMDEPECEANHRGNILNRNFTHVGIGATHCDDGNIYVTQDFAAFSFDDIRDDPNEYCEY